MFKKIQKIRQRSDFRDNPIKAILKRVLWKFRWKLNHSPWLIPFSSRMKILLPNTGSGALIYYQDFSEPDTARFIQKILKPGMIFVDIGAHIGEYTLLSAELLGETGHIYAFEPQPKIYNLLESNIKVNQLKKISIESCALSNQEGKVEFTIFSEPSVSSIKTDLPNSSEQNYSITDTIQVSTITLDSYFGSLEDKIDLIKLDVEGAELMVFQGAKKYLEFSEATAPIWLFEFSPRNYKDFGYDAKDLFSLLESYGYIIYEYSNGQLNTISKGIKAKQRCNFVASKRELSWD